MAVRPALLDLNLLTALLWPRHEHHEVAHTWFDERRVDGWATCPLTQLGFVRLVSNPAFSRDALSVGLVATCDRGLGDLAAQLGAAIDVVAT